MTARYYEARAEFRQDHCLQIRLPPDIPVGSVRVAIIFESDLPAQDAGDKIKNLLGSMPDVAEDADFSGPCDLGREGPVWDS